MVERKSGRMRATTPEFRSKSVPGLLVRGREKRGVAAAVYVAGIFLGIFLAVQRLITESKYFYR